MSRYTAITDADRAAMLAAIGVGSAQELFDSQIPEQVRLRRPLDLPAGLGEQEVYEHLRSLAQRNVSCEDQLSFLGGGFYDHYVPAIVDMLCERSEFLTPYTPYQPEVSQGGLQVMFEYQTAISELTALPVSNASVYEGPSAAASAAYMARIHNRREKIVVSAGLHPHTLQSIRTYAHGFGSEVVEVPLCGEGLTGADGGPPPGAGVTDIEAWAQAIDGRTSAAIFAQPNFYGAVEDAQALAEVAHERGQGAVVVCQADPVTLGILKPPGECGVDVAVGEGQPFGGRLDYGGPSFGFFAATEALMRKMPGRIAGETVDADGRRGFVLTLQTREQHIRREKATSNICTAQALNALAGMVHLAWLGRRGIVELGELLLARADYARRRLCEIEGVSPMHTQPVVRELAVRIDADLDEVRSRCIAGGDPAGVNPGIDIERLTGRESDRGGLLVAITERRSRADIDRLAEVLAEAIAECRAVVA